MKDELLMNQRINETRSTEVVHFSYGKLVFLTGLAVLLSSFSPFFVLSPAPLAFALLVYGTRKALSAIGIALVLLVTYTFVSAQPFHSGVLFAVASLFAYCIYRVIQVNVAPVKGLLVTGLGLLISGAILYFALGKGLGISVQQEVEQQVASFITQIKSNPEYETLLATGGDEVRMLQDIIREPEVLVSNVVSWFPATLFISTFLTLWMSFYFVLRHSLAWRTKHLYRYGIRDLLMFKTPEWMIWIVIALLVLAVGGDFIVPDTISDVGVKGLVALSIFYFFQGYGLFMDFLSFMRIHGFFRLFVMVGTLLMAWKALIFFGLFDVWFNFRKFLKKKSN